MNAADSLPSSAPVAAVAAAPAAAIARLIALLDVEALEVDLFRGQSTDFGFGRVYGGQVVAQALMAASRTVRSERLAHSLHAYFLRAGDPHAPIIYRVERDRDGSSFATRRVVAIQHGRPIFNLAASFQIDESGLDHGAPMPRVAGPDLLENTDDLYRRWSAHAPEAERVRWLSRDRPIEVRPVDPVDRHKPKRTRPSANNWVRLAAPQPADPVLARCLLAYASDMTLLDTCLLPHAISFFDPALQAASLDHAIWFHATPDLNEWLLVAQDSPRASGGRGLSRGLVYTRTGTVVATLMQEGLIRYRGSGSGDR